MTLEAQLSKVIEESIKQTQSNQSLVDTALKSMDKIDEFSAKTEQVFNLSKDNSDAITQWHTTTQDTVQFKKHDGKTYTVDSLKTLIGKADAIRPHEAAMSKAQFDALREIRKKQYAGSGFVEWGKHIEVKNVHGTINEGFYSHITTPNMLRIARESDGTGISRSPFPIVSVDGVLHKIDRIASDSEFNRNGIKFPPAPDGTKTYDSSTGAIAKHASVNEAFEGVISNGDFRYGNDGTWQQTGNIQISEAGADFASTLPNKQLWQDIQIAHTDYTISFLANQTGKLQLYIYGEGEQDGVIDVDIKEGFNQFTIKASERSLNFNKDHAFLIRDSIGSRFNGIINQLSVMPISQSVVTSRKDLVFLESWHEKIADKDIIYPFGNVQFGNGKYEGITLKNDLVPQAYSAFGEWDKSTFGFGTKWSALSDAQKAVFLSKPEHNIYYDPEAKAYIQVRYRVRVIEGLGDDWRGKSDLSGGTGVCPFESRYLGHGDFNREHWSWMYARGENIEVKDLAKQSPPESLIFQSSSPKATTNSVQKDDVGLWRVLNSSVVAIPIALVQRLNQGAYHPSYNPMGTAQYTMLGVSNYHWHELPTSLLKSTLGCFILPTETSIGRHPGMGYVGGHGHSRTDQYRYYDVIYSGQVEDLRLNANKLDVNQLRKDTMRKAIAGALRGKGRCLFTHFKTLNSGYFAASNQFNAAFEDAIGGKTLDFYGNGLSEGTSIMVWQPSNGVTLYGKVTANGHAALTDKPENLSASAHINPARLGLSMADICYFAEVKELSSEFESLPWVDIIGHPNRIAATFPDGVVGQWVATPTGGDMSLTHKANLSSDKIDSVLYTTDDGKTWNARSQNFSHITNSVLLDSTISAESNVIMINYESLSHFTEPSSNSIVVGDVSNVWAGNDARVDFGNRLQSSLTDKVGTTVAYTTNINVPVTGYSIYKSKNSPYFKDRLALDEPPTHTELPHLGGTDGNSAAKALPTITEKDGLYYLQLHGAEMQYKSHQAENANSSALRSYIKGTVYRFTEGAFKGLVVLALNSMTNILENVCYVNNGDIIDIASGSVIFSTVNLRGSWGDDQTIQVFYGENIKTDLNGNSVKAFCHHTQFPIGISHTQ